MCQCITYKMEYFRGYFILPHPVLVGSWSPASHGNMLRIENIGSTSWKPVRSSSGHARDDNDDDVLVSTNQGNLTSLQHTWQSTCSRETQKLTVSIRAFVSNVMAFSTTMISGCTIAILIFISPPATAGVETSWVPPPKVHVFYSQQQQCTGSKTSYSFSR